MRMRFYLVSLALISMGAFSTVSAGATAHAEQELQSPGASSKELQAIFDDYEEYHRTDHLRAGLKGESTSLPNIRGVTPDDDARRRAHLVEFQTRLARVMEGDLSVEDGLNAAVLAQIVDRHLQEIYFDSERIVFNSETGPEEVLASIQRSAALRSRSDVETYIKRLETAAAHFDDAKANARRGIATGFIQPRVVTEHTLRQMREQAQLPADEDIAFKPLLSLPDSISKRDQDRFRARAREMIEKKVRPAQQAFVEMIETEYLPQARESLAITDVPDGRDYYLFLVRKFTTTDLTPEEIHEIGRREVSLLRAEMEKEMKAAGWQGSLAGFIEFLRNDPQFYAKSREELLLKAAGIAKEIDGEIPRFFRTPPRLTYNVSEVPRAIEDNYTTARYNLGSLEAGIAGSFVVNTSHLNQRPLYELTDLALHEGVPGHHLQIAIRQESDIPGFRRHFQFDAYTEGWAHYAEWLGLEMGVYKTPYDRFGLLSAYMWRACRLVADTGIHWLGWSLEEAGKCFHENSALAPRNIETELRRYVAWPGQALSYKIGELKIRELRARAEAELGEGFDIRLFHDMILWGGDLPLDLLEEQTDRWIATQLEKKS